MKVRALIAGVFLAGAVSALADAWVIPASEKIDARTARTLARKAVSGRWKSLSLAGHREFSDAAMRPFHNAVELKDLDLSGTGITDSGLVSMENMNLLEKLNLSGTKVSGIGLQYLKKLKNLKDLDLSNTPIHNWDLLALKEFPELETLRLNNTPVTDEGLSQIRGWLPYLKTLDVKCTDVSGKALSAFPNQLSSDNSCSE
jgi:Leucine-rich repeat (LRR) protein